MEHLKPNMLTEIDGNSPIYITKRRSHQGEEIYVNNAMIIKSRSNVDMKNEAGKKQVSETGEIRSRKDVGGAGDCLESKR